MKIQCVWEHNGDDSILYSANFVGAFTRGKSKDEAVRKMPSEILSYLAWKGDAPPDALEPTVVLLMSLLNLFKSIRIIQ